MELPLRDIRILQPLQKQAVNASGHLPLAIMKNSECASRSEAWKNHRVDRAPADAVARHCDECGLLVPGSLVFDGPVR